MYVPFGKSVDDVTFLSSLRHLFCPRLKNTIEHNLWQKPLYHQKIRKPKDNTKTPPNNSITQRLQTVLERSVGVTSDPTGVVKQVGGYPTFPQTAKAV